MAEGGFDDKVEEVREGLSEQTVQSPGQVPAVEDKPEPASLQCLHQPQITEYYPTISTACRASNCILSFTAVSTMHRICMA